MLSTGVRYADRAVVIRADAIDRCPLRGPGRRDSRRCYRPAWGHLAPTTCAKRTFESARPIGCGSTRAAGSCRALTGDRNFVIECPWMFGICRKRMAGPGYNVSFRQAEVV